MVGGGTRGRELHVRHEAAGVRSAARWRGGRVADGGARAAPAMPVIGFLSPQPVGTSGPFLDAFRRGLAETGYVEGQNVAIEYRITGGQLDRLPALAADLVRLRASVIATSGSSAAVAAKAATRTIPIAFSVPEDPVKLGLVASLARPGGNATGINFLSTEVTTKRMGLLRELVPTAVQVAVLINPTNPANTSATLTEVEAVARALGLQVAILQSQHQRRDRFGVRDPRARAVRRFVSRRGRILHQPARPAGRIVGAACAACDLLDA